ncbi:hypothetical protein EI42_03525 [Thermosporothrix hazakensis]|jgi:hypothetical protein|uniref:Uncharacterized protein n=1 Tax=Thermosporothrix hazakensis TaxID=644383 RepID=A0A326U448_THEHA|nr:hypothetical protein EI42_03525 [Thermosporothrix hazakensis]
MYLLKCIHETCPCLFPSKKETRALLLCHLKPTMDNIKNS